MKRLLVIGLVFFAACSDATAPDVAALHNGIWYVTLADGRRCNDIAFDAIHVSRPEQAIAVCRAR